MGKVGSGQVIFNEDSFSSVSWGGSHFVGKKMHLWKGASSNGFIGSMEIGTS